MSRLSKKPLAIALGAAFALTGFGAQASVFQTSDLGAGYMVASAGDKAGEKKCGEKKGSNCDAKAGVDAKTGECACGAAKGKKADGKCGEGKCGDKKAKKAEGKCGEGKCGDKK